jgi:RNA polymerase sigma factor (sigma-70 family)
MTSDTPASENPFDRLEQYGSSNDANWREQFCAIVHSVVVESCRHQVPRKMQSWFVAEDLSQETALKCLEKFARDGVPSHLTTSYVVVVAKRVLIDQLRRQLASKRAPELGFANVSPTSSMNLLNDVTRNDRTPSQLAILNEIWPIVAAYLSEREQEIIQLRYLEQLSTQEIASLLGTTDSAIRSLLNRTHAKLREELQQRPEFESFC